MDRKPLFDFDIRASTDKKKRARGRRGMSGAWETSVRQCEHPGCTLDGKYRCPKSPDQLNEYIWFCKDHAREYNLKWNYFDGQSEAEMLDSMEKDRVWGRATKPLGENDERLAWQRLGIEDPHQVLGDKATQNPGRRASPMGGTRKLPPTERKAIEILEARDSWSRSEIRKQYKSLVKDLHPDRNAGARHDEERLQEVVWAWDQIKDSRNFRD